MAESEPLLSRARGGNGRDCPAGSDACVQVGPGERRRRGPGPAGVVRAGPGPAPGRCGHRGRAPPGRRGRIGPGQRGARGRPPSGRRGAAPRDPGPGAERGPRLPRTGRAESASRSPGSVGARRPALCSPGVPGRTRTASYGETEAGGWASPGPGGIPPALPSHSRSSEAPRGWSPPGQLPPLALGSPSWPSCLPRRGIAESPEGRRAGRAESGSPQGFSLLWPRRKEGEK